jgi:phospholipid transport system transporter-binding protein
MDSVNKTKQPGHDLLGRFESDDGGWRVLGDMNFASVPVLISQSMNLLKFEGDMIIDLSGIDHTDSSGLALMLEWMDISNAAGGRIQFRKVPESLMNIARVCNVAPLLPLAG